VCSKSTCGATGPAVAKMGGLKQSHRDGLYRCKACRGQFTVTVGTIFQRSKVPLNDWLWAIHLFSATQPVTIREIEIELAVTYKTAFQMWKRVCAVLRGYRGHNKGFGPKVTAFITSTRPKSIEGLANWRDKSKKLLNGENGVPKVTGLLSTFASHGSAENFERTERLLRVLLAAVPKPSKSAKKKAAKLRRLERGAVLAATPHP
jgi:transposase-like protein